MKLKTKTIFSSNSLTDTPAMTCFYVFLVITTIITTDYVIII